MSGSCSARPVPLLNTTSKHIATLALMDAVLALLAWFRSELRHLASEQLLHSVVSAFTPSSDMKIFVSVHFLSKSGTMLSIAASIYRCIVLAISPTAIRAFLARHERRESANCSNPANML